MSGSGDDGYRYNMTIKMFGVEGEPAFESPSEQKANWGRVWGCDNDVGRLRVVLMHRPGPELNVVDPSKRIESIGTFGDLEKNWYWQSDTIPALSEMQEQHDGLVKAMRDEGVEVVFVEGDEGHNLKSCYTRDPLFAIKGGAIVTRMGARIRRGEEHPISRTLANLGMPILRTIHCTGLVEGGSFAWLNSRTAVLGHSIRVNDEGVRQVEEVLRAQGVELIRIDLGGYDIHIDGGFLMVDVETALVHASSLPYSFLEKLKELGIRTVETNPEDDGWIVNGLAVRPGRVLMPPGISNRTLDQLTKLDIEVVTLPYDKMQLNGGGIHCSTCPLIRDPV